MDRREALRRTALMMGGALSAPTILGILNGCTAKPTLDWKPQFFSEDQGSLVAELAEIIIPKTDTPGAKDVGIHNFIDIMVKDVYSKEDQQSFLDGLKAFDDEAKKDRGDNFMSLSDEDRVSFAKKLHDDAIAANAKDKPFILKMKELTVAGYFTSEVGATQVLQYEAVPGAYHGCVPLSEAGNGKTWAT